jgi:hypothetical protein
MATATNLPAAAVSGDILTAAYVNDLRGAFRVLQVVQGNTSTVANNSTATYADTGLTATITPQSTTNKILVLVSQAGCSKSAASAFNALALQLLRGTTSIQTFAQFAGYTGGADARYLNIGNQNTVFLDSPASIAAQTYKTQFKNVGIGAALVTVQDNTGSTVNNSTITLIEISA